MSSLKLLTGDESLAKDLRTSTAIELFNHAEMYASHKIIEMVMSDKNAKFDRESYIVALMSEDTSAFYRNTGKNLVKAIKHEALATCTNGRWSVMLHILALSTITRHTIWSLYPEVNKALRPLFHRMISPLRCSNPLPVIYVLWSRDGNLDNRKGAVYEPNHFIPFIEDPFEPDDDFPIELLHEIETKCSDMICDEKPDESEENANKPEKIIEKKEMPDDIIERTEKPRDLIVRTEPPDEMIERTTMPDEMIERTETQNEMIEITITPDEMVERTTTPNEMIERTTTSDEMIGRTTTPNEMIERTTTPDEMIEKPTTPDEMIEKPTTPDEMIERTTMPDEMIERTTTPDEMIERTTTPDEMIERTTTPDEMIEKEDEPDTSDMLSFSRRVLYPGEIGLRVATGSSSGFDTEDDLPLQYLVQNETPRFSIENDHPVKCTTDTNEETDFSSDDGKPLTYLILSSTPKKPTLKSKQSKSTKQKSVPDKKISQTLSDSENEEDIYFSDESDIHVHTPSSSSSEDESPTQEDEGLHWVKKVIPMKPRPFNGPVPGSVITLASTATPLDYFLQLFPGDIWKNMEIATNNYVPIYEAKRRANTTTDLNWTDSDHRYITSDDLKAYIGIRMITALDPKAAIEDYWSTNPALGNEYIKQTMSRRRFLNITRYIHINDPINDPVRVTDLNEKKRRMTAEPLYKVSNLLDHVHMKCKELYNLHQQLSLDEAMVKCHGQHWGIVGAPNKPAKRGFKVWTLADGTSGYIYDFEVYLRKEREIGLTQRVVESLTNSLYGRYHIVFVDKYYTSIALAQSLLRNKTYICGSFNTSRIYWPTDLKPDKRKPKKNDPVRNLKRGESLARQTKKGDIVACVWKDSATVFNLSTCYDVVPNQRRDVIDRKVRSEKSGGWIKEAYACPPSIIEYNKYMGGVDRHDHLRSSYSLQRSSPKWWMYIAWFAIDVALVNAYLIYKETFPKETHKKFQLQVSINDNIL